MTEDTRPECFIAMPITVHEDEAKLYRDAKHWEHVMEQLFIPAIEKAGFRPIKPFTNGSGMIMARIVQYLAEAPMVLCDLSQLNPNVMYELGVRTSLDKPIALVKDEHLTMPFDIGGINTHKYDSSISSWDLESQVSAIAAHIVETANAGEGNPMWRRFGVGIVANTPTSNESPTEARLDVLSEQVDSIARALRPSDISDTSYYPDHALTQLLSTIPGVTGVRIGSRTPEGVRVVVETEASSSKNDHWNRAMEIEDQLRKAGLATRVKNQSATAIDIVIL